MQKKLNSLITNYYNFFLGKMYFTSSDGSQNTFVNQPTLDTLESKKDEVLIMFLVGNRMVKLKPLYTAFLQNLIDIKLEQNLIKIL